MPLESDSIGIPERFTLDDAAGVLRISWTWPRLLAVPAGIFAVAWDSFLVTWYLSTLADGSPSLVELLFPIGHVAVGLAVPYAALAFLLNTTAVEVQQGEIRVRHRPLPWPGNRTLSVSDVRQLFSVERRGRKGATSYAVMARLASDREVVLVSSLPGERDARFLEQRIESRLGLADRAVAGELPRI